MLEQFRNSTSMVIASVSLFVALGGVSYAAATIGSAEIKNNSVRGKDIRNGTLRGKDVGKDTLGGSHIAESKLGEVPAATTARVAGRADSAGTASNADKLGHLGPSGYMKVDPNRVRTVDGAGDTDYLNMVSLTNLPDLAAGRYVVQAKVDIDNDTNAAEFVECQLATNQGGPVNVLDRSEQELGASGAGGERLGYSVSVVFESNGTGGDLLIRCGQAGADNDASNARIIATRVD